MTVTEPPIYLTASERQALDLRVEAIVTRAVAMIRRGRALALGDRRRAATLLMARREALCRLLQRYQRLKHDCIFDPVVQRGTASSKMVARNLKTECIQMGETFGAYHARWQYYDASDPSEWPRYRDDMLESTDALLAHLAAERQAVFRLLMISSFYDQEERAA
jgi:hypothetical protein